MLGNCTSYDFQTIFYTLEFMFCVYETKSVALIVAKLPSASISSVYVK